MMKILGRTGSYNLQQPNADIKEPLFPLTLSKPPTQPQQDRPKQVLRADSPTQYLMTGQRSLSIDKRSPSSIQDIREHGELIGKGQEGEVYKWSSSTKNAEDRALKIITYRSTATGQPYASSSPTWNAQCWNKFYGTHQDPGIRQYATARTLTLPDGKTVLDTPFLQKSKRDPYDTEYTKVEKNLKQQNIKITDLHVPGNVCVVRSPVTNKEYAVPVDFGRAEERLKN